MKKLIVLLTVAAFAVGAYAQSPLGAWKGKIQVDPSVFPTVTDPKQKQAIEQAKAQIKQVTLNLTMRANKTFTIAVPPLGNKKGTNAEGTWTQKGRSITLVTTKQDGKKPTSSKPQTMTIDPSGKKMSLISAEAGGKFTIIFTK